jgi:hypothetical protein
LLKNSDDAGGGRRYVLLHSLAFFADDVADAITRVPEQLHTDASTYEGQHARNDGA